MVTIDSVNPTVFFSQYIKYVLYNAFLCVFEEIVDINDLVYVAILMLLNIA